ncbi:tRNA (adenosine(37)-N6)-threonylcarbamoyltransferase complex ATPase subunit type 1 TsaE [Shewanella salipaludis]|uniref:tRNA threonylcarbamoyladenosine biosynthesis protein TsaE n=1 Tax=Shewanella salipaludis TaxID=2723052 RepID=A0A972G0K9_9GAMM|nr:tRNA (adenosine(37)-N6)-threonylcarbamoyltransferase complex ATPase subunit type 1 TsaE [Shewanella salipaludis]NMH65311.1 tRNA (adenosine(37)-N6)-threonylcarbamoyltransferase complex ATPase subunit type 1 TsaE [Shewanella salipaludis]
MTAITFFLETETETLDLGRKLAALMRPPFTLYLSGELGAGKTTLSRGIVQGLGHEGAVKSPTYTLVEPYELADVEVYHFDLYRLNDPEELEYMGIRDYFSATSLCIVEWPEKGMGLLPEADIQLHLQYADGGREVRIEAKSIKGQALLNNVK